MDLSVSDADLTDLLDRVGSTRWATGWPVDAWQAGTDEAVLRRLARHWVTGFDWRARESRMASLPWGSVDLDGTALSYLRFEGEDSKRLPVVLTNGWPSTALELVELARRLSRPSEHGGDPDDAMTVIVPALPGFPFSPPRPTLGDQTHELWHRLMTDELGFSRYVAHGGDLGAGITSRLAQSHPEEVAGIHLLAVGGPTEYDPAGLASDERAHLDEVASWSATEGAYEHQQRTRPLTLAPALSDSPVGLLSWLLEKHRAWSDCAGDVSTRFSDDYLLELASLYWFTGAASTALRPYWEHAAGHTTPVIRVSVPTAVAVFPRDQVHPPRRWAERTHDVVRFTEMPRGGHFAPHEEPELLAADIASFSRDLT